MSGGTGSRKVAFSTTTSKPDSSSHVSPPPQQQQQQQQQQQPSLFFSRPSSSSTAVSPRHVDGRSRGAVMGTPSSTTAPQTQDARIPLHTTTVTPTGLPTRSVKESSATRSLSKVPIHTPFSPVTPSSASRTPNRRALAFTPHSSSGVGATPAGFGFSSNLSFSSALSPPPSHTSQRGGSSSRLDSSPARSPFTSSTTGLVDTGASVSSPWVTVFGFGPKDASRVRSIFESYGTVMDIRSSRGNWMDLQYQTKTEAERALSKNGMKIGDLMIGVLPTHGSTSAALSSSSGSSSLSPARSMQRTPRTLSKSTAKRLHDTAIAEYDVSGGPDLKRPKKEGLLSRVVKFFVGS